MRSGLPFGVMGAAATSASAPVIRALLLRGQVMDVPNHRSSHTVAVVRGGGLACISGAALTAFALDSRMPGRAVTAVAGLALVGLIDDTTGGIPAIPRLVGQCALGALAGSTYGLRIAGIGAVVMPVVVNIVNFMDGVNGITGLSCVVWGISAANSSAGADVSQLGALTAGLGAGFLPWNAPVPLMFLGDAGSYFLGALMACGVIHAARSLELRAVLVTTAPLLPYLADGAQAIVSRCARGESLTEAHRDHVYQRLVDHCGVTHVQVAAFHAAAATLCALGARARRPWVAVLASLVPAVIYVLSPKLVDGGSA